MSFTQSDLDHLKKLARIEFDDATEEEAFLCSMKNIVIMLEDLQGLDLGELESSVFLDKTMHLHQGQKDFDDSNALLANVEHPLMNNSIVVKSVLED